MKVFRFYCRYWAAIGGLLFVLLAFFVGLMPDLVPATQRLTILLFMALLFHQFEEYVFPGGFPAAANRGLFGEKEDVARFPLNELSQHLLGLYALHSRHILPQLLMAGHIHRLLHDGAGADALLETEHLAQGLVFAGMSFISLHYAADGCVLPLVYCHPFRCAALLLVGPYSGISHCGCCNDPAPHPDLPQS